MAILYLLCFCTFASLAFAGLIDRGQDAADAMKYSKMDGFFRVEVFADRLDTQGKSHTGLPCDVFDSCDPKVMCFIDTEKPNNDFGGDSVPYANYVTLFDGNNVNVPQVSQSISRDVCGKSPRKIAIRCRAIDKDGINDDKIDNYKWHLTSDMYKVADNEQSAEWSAEIAIPGEDRPSSKMYVKARMFKIPETQCRPSTNGQGLFSGLFS